MIALQTHAATVALALVAAAPLAAAQLTFTATQITRGTGPDPPSVTSPAPSGTYSPPASVVFDGNTYPPPSETGMGRQAHLVGPDNFCLYAPPDPTKQNLVDAEADAVAYCLGQAWNDTRPMPDYFIKTAHYRTTPDYVQVSGTYQWTRLNLNPGDCGGEYDNHGPGGVGNPVGAQVDGATDWNQFLGHCDIPDEGTFCIRACHGGNSYPYCRNTFDLMGCLWTMPGDYQEEGFTSCEADSDLPIGVYNDTYTFAQGQSYTPPPVTAPASSNCKTVASPTASGVTYTFAQLAYESGYTPSSSSASGSRSASGSGASGPSATGAGGGGGSGGSSGASNSPSSFATRSTGDVKALVGLLGVAFAMVGGAVWVI